MRGLLSWASTYLGRHLLLCSPHWAHFAPGKECFLHNGQSARLRTRKKRQSQSSTYSTNTYVYPIISKTYYYKEIYNYNYIRTPLSVITSIVICMSIRTYATYHYVVTIRTIILWMKQFSSTTVTSPTVAWSSRAGGTRLLDNALSRGSGLLSEHCNREWKGRGWVVL